MTESQYPYFCVEHSQATPGKADTPRFLLIMPIGIGDAIAVGSTMTDQIIKNDPEAWGSIDIMCNEVQAELFQYDPRINRIIRVDRGLFPNFDSRTWIRGIIRNPKATPLVHFLRKRRYEAIFPGLFAPALYYRLHAPLVFPGPSKLVGDFWALRKHIDRPISKTTRQLVNAYFKVPEPEIDEEIPLYLSSELVQQAKAAVARIKEIAPVSSLGRGAPLRSPCKLLVVGPDTTSIVTRPPTSLLAGGIAGALKSMPGLLVAILPGYTDTRASKNLWHALSADFADRLFLMSADPRPSLLETTAFIDQADIFLTGDTGLMHLATATKKLGKADSTAFTPRNSVKIIAIFGGTNPGLYGYSKRTLIVGRGRKEQMQVGPNIFKEAYNSSDRDFFDHISPCQVTEAILDSFGE